MARPARVVDPRARPEEGDFELRMAVEMGRAGEGIHQPLVQMNVEAAAQVAVIGIIADVQRLTSGA